MSNRGRKEMTKSKIKEKLNVQIRIVQNMEVEKNLKYALLRFEKQYEA